MEPTTRFNLNAVLEEWRRELRHQPGLGEDSLKELEQHLTQSMEELRGRGLGEEEAFLVARHRVGSPARLGEEFRKADPTAVWRGRMLWMVAGWGTMTLWGALIEPLWTLIVGIFNKPGGGMGGLGALAMLAYFVVKLAPLGIAALMSRGRLIHWAEWLTPLFRSRFRAAVVVTLGAFLILWVGRVGSLVFIRSVGLGDSRFPGADLLLLSALVVALQGLLGGLLLIWLMPTRTARET